jgi:hypothetical protein
MYYVGLYMQAETYETLNVNILPSFHHNLSACNGVQTGGGDISTYGNLWTLSGQDLPV